MKYGIDTRCQHLADDNKDEIYGAISYPIYQSATFARDRVGGGSGYDYSRLQNPTREHLEKIVASLEEGIDALAFSTGMAAITALMEIFKPGDHIIIDEDLYGGSVRLFHSINVKNGLTFTSVDLSSVDVEDYIQDNTKAIYAETPTNPMMRVSDLKELSKKERAYHILENVKLIQFAESLGGTETLITYPITQTHADLSREELDRNGITDRILRLSVGIEGAEDLIADLEAVLKKIK